MHCINQAFAVVAGLKGRQGRAGALSFGCQVMYTDGMVVRASILERVIEPGRGGFSAEFAREVLKFGFPPADHARYEELSARAQNDELSEEESAELEEYLNVNDFLTILKAKAEASLRTKGSAA